jgi:hypothetical protein
MEAPAPTSDMPAPPAGFVHTDDPRRTELLLDALKAALATPGEHRLFRSGKLHGLFPFRTGLSSEAALFAIRERLLETLRTETKGKLVVEWVRATPRAVGFVHENDSPRSVLRELKDVLRATRAGVPEWMAEAKQELAALSANFEERAAAMLARLDDLAKRVEGALRRAETGGPAVGESVARVVPWAMEALEYLDRRNTSGATGDCPLPELFHAVCVRFPELTLPAFQDGVRRLHDVRAVRLARVNDSEVGMIEPEYAMVIDGQMMYWVAR